MQPAGPTGSLPFFWMGICRGPDDGDSKTGQGQTASSEKYADFARYRNYGLLLGSAAGDTAYISIRLLVNLMPARGPEGISPGLFHTYAPCLFQGFPARQTSPQTHGLHHSTLWHRSEERKKERKKESILRLFQTPD